MWVPPYTHPLFDAEKQKVSRERWTDAVAGQGSQYHDRVLALIKAGAGKRFLNEEFCNGSFSILEDPQDLKGFEFWKLVQDFAGTGDTFWGIDLSYAQGWHLHIKNAVFYSCCLNFVSFYNCTFERCNFHFTHCLGAKFEKCKFIGCDFCEPCTWENTVLKNTTLQSCFLGETTPFRDCFFDDLSGVYDMHPHSYYLGEKAKVPEAALAGYYASFQAAYEASGAEERALEYYWKGRKAFTRHNLSGPKRLASFVNEAIAGYGIKPVRPLGMVLLLYVLATSLFSIVMPLKESVVFTAGALFTFGAAADHLNDFGYVGRLFYVSLSFFGIILSALFVTSLANLWFRSRIPTRSVKTRYSE